ncbi:MAG TPA: hypothetical protein VFS25_25085 [Chitinophaga sp.]|uniref:hypothetical protein n=1 Tax=Chitinophaga sp. TaxID=1869181 RepID=UPI002DB853B9|nr:hypothetical protein [Chitinophaga sp.]HEU4556146.1 hypothetical protein [Chitinophaga sp.]
MKTPPLIGFFLTLGILLLSGYNQLSANTYRDCIRCAHLRKILETLAPGRFDVLQDSQAWIPSVPSASKKNHDKIIDETENDDEKDEAISFKKYLEIGSYFIAVFYTPIAENCCTNTKKPLSFNQHFSCCSSYSRYIILHVIRI